MSCWSYKLFSSMNHILNQLVDAECAIFATLNCLEIMKPDLDILKILEEMKPDFDKILTHRMALNWLKKRWYIRDYQSYRYNPLTVSKTPVIARIYNVDWWRTNSPPYRLVPWPDNKNAHYVCIVGKGKAENSWWEQWWDKGYFYFTPDQLSHFSFITRIIV